ncbi:glycoside hydrolase family 115 protein [Aspergillus alliaceus]|uniref:glycoside hydrolase family 115 protein n=1 Tax=Petromyces alliaceus TaxID=209559 RepID=UPI0012A699A1|nr:uncharacterized protein BDW43DRAFT_241902 [Aspergillus alliaceus]KAB8236674.1 hypothetical protein BDW43DRAFT_241902 [Aspergillus alliaceus]
MKNPVLPIGSSRFVEADGHVSIYATSFTYSSGSSYWTLPDIIRTQTGGVALISGTPALHLEYLQYPFLTISPTAAAILTLEFTLTLGTNPNAYIAYDISINDRAVSTHRLVPQLSKPDTLPD